MNDEEFVDFCLANPELRIEQDNHGNLHIMSPVSFESGRLENSSTPTRHWSRESGPGQTFSPSTLFILPDGEKRLPDAAWISQAKVDGLTTEERRSFARIVPDFIIELKSPSDSAIEIDLKIREIWIANGVRLARYLDPEKEIARVYYSGGDIQDYQGFDRSLSGGDVLPDFQLDLRSLKLT